MIPNTNSGTNAPAELRSYMSWYAIESMPEFGKSDPAKNLAAIQAAGYVGVQFNEADSAEKISACRALGLGVAQSGRIAKPTDADALVERLAGDGAECATIHLGTGLEDDGEGGRLIEALLHASTKHHLPLYAETHRATLLQDVWRAVQFANKFPELRFNGDFSHWYTGAEMIYGNVEEKVAFLKPVLDRVRFMHGRISDPGCIQVLVDTSTKQLCVEHFKLMWTAAFAGFLASAAPGDFFCFAPELLAPDIYYARTVPNASGEMVEEGDRWQQSLVLRNIAQECFANAANL